MDKVFEPNSSFDFTKLSLGHPQTTKGGSYFTKILYDNVSLYIQFPKCKTKQGIIQTEKNIFSDLLYETTYNNELNEWIEHLENKCQKLLFEKNNLWFSGDIELDDIESAFTNAAKMYKSGKQFLIRCYIPKPQLIKTTQSCFVYDENENQLSINDVDVSKEIIPLIKINGIKFTNKSFQLEFTLAQVMIMKLQDEFNHCLIKPSISNNLKNNHSLQSSSILFSKDKTNEQNNSNIKTQDITSNKCISLEETTLKNINNDDNPAISISFEEKKDVDIEKGNIIDNLHISDEGEDDDEDDEDEGEEDEDEEEDDDEGEEDEDEGEEDEDDEDDDKINDRVNNETNQKNQSYNLEEVNDLEINGKDYIFEKNINIVNPLLSSFNKTFDLERNSSKINEEKSLDDVKKNDLELVDLNVDSISDSIKLRKPNEVYYEIYKAAREKAKRAKKVATEAYLEAKSIKTKYMLDYLDESDEDEIYS